MRKLYTNPPAAAVYVAITVLMLFSVFTSNKVNAQNVTVNPGAGSYATLKDAFDAINAGTHTGAVTVSIVGNTTENASAVLNASGTGAASYTSVNITPAGARTVSGSVAGHLVDLNGADNVTIDGLNSSGNSLIIDNTNTSTSATTIRFFGDAVGNTIQNTTIRGGGTSATLGTIFFSTGTTTGNDNNTISNCTIDASGSNFPVNGIYCSGTTTAGVENSAVTIQGNNIANFFSASAVSMGININAGAAEWTISSNKLYQSASRTYTTANTHKAINIAGNGNGYVVSNNTIGFATNTGTGVYTMTGTIATRFIAIDLAVGTTTATSVQGNTIASISLTTSSGAATANGVICGINITAGNVNVGTVNGNTIGSTSATASLVAIPSTTQGSIMGINSSSGGTIVIQNNSIGGFQAGGTTAAIAGGVFGINVSGAAASMTITGNTIGNSTANNMVAGTLGTTTGSSLAAGISLVSTSSVALITNNTIQNFASFGTGTGGYVRGIRTTTSGTTGSCTISGNIIRNLTTNSGLTGAGSGQVSAQGIHFASGLNPQIFQNEIYSIFNTNTATTNLVVGGIGIAEASSSAIYANKIYGLSNSGTGTTATTPPIVAGIFVRSGATVGTHSIYNNMISLGEGETTNTTFVGIWGNHGSTPDPTAVNVYFNSIHIGGTVTSGALPSFGIQRGDFTTTARTVPYNIRNNIFNNSRSGGTGKHYAIANNFGATVSTTGWGNNASNYNLLNSANPATVGHWSTDRDFNAWKSNSSGDGLSFSGYSSNFIGASTGNLHINPVVATPIESGGVALPGITTDFDGNTRNTATPDVGADEGNFTVLDLSAPLVAYTVLNSTCTTGNITLTATIGDGTGVPTSGTLVPRIYYKKGAAGAWFSNAGTLSSGTATNGTWSFTIVAADMGGLAVGDQVFYYVIAQDVSASNFISSNPSGVVATDVNTVTTHPGTPNSFVINPTLSGNYNVGSGNTYATINAAVNAYNNACLAGAVTFTLTDATYGSETFPIAINANPMASAVNTLTIKPAANTAVLVSGTSGASASALIRLNGADYVTIDGVRDNSGTSLTLENTSSTGGTAVIWLSSNGADQGATNNTIKNVNLKAGVDQKANATVTYGIVISGSTLSATITSVTAGLDNDNNTIDTCYFTKVRYGIYVRGGSAANPNTGNIIKRNIIGPSAFGVDQIGKVGILAREEDGIQIINNEIRYVGGDFANNPASTAIVRAGIAMATDGTWAPTAVLMKNAIVRSNIIHDIQDEKTGGALGVILAATDGTNATNNIVANNFIYNVKANGTTSPNQAVGIGIAAGNGDKVVYNSINMNGLVNGAGATVPTVSNFGIRVSSTSASNLSLLNNVVYMDLTGGGALKNFCIDLPTGYTWGTGNMNFNNWFANTANSQSNTGSINNGGTAYATLSDWRTASGKDLDSKDVDPLFVSLTDLHLQSSSPMDGQGTPVPGVTTDIDNQNRDVTTPDMGADELPAAVGVDLKPQELISPAVAAKGCYNTETVTVSIKNNGSTTVNFVSNPVTVNVSVSGAATFSYPAKLINTGSLAAGAILNVTISTVGVNELDMSVPGVYVFDITTSVAGDVNTANDALQETRTKEALTVGTVSVSPADYCNTGGKPTLTSVAPNGYTALQWQQSTASGSGYSNIAGATTPVFTVAANITQTMYYKLIATCGTGTDESVELNVVLNNPQPLSTTPGSRCGTGTVTLSATASPGATINWYSASTGGVPLATGNSFTTPVINATQNYFVGVSSGSGGAENVASPTVGTSTFWTATAGWGLRFTVNTATTISSVKMYPSNSTAGAATLQVRVTDLNDAVLFSGPVYNFTAATTSTEHTVPVNISLPPGDYKMVMSSTGINNLIRESGGVTFPYKPLSNAVSITAGANGAGTAQTTSAYYWFYSWVLSSGCEGTRVQVAATVTPPPALTVTADKTICNNAIHQLSVTSTLADFDSYVWSPATGLFTDAAATIPYTGTSATTVYVKNSTAGSTIYTVTATNNTSNCVNTATSTVVVLPVVGITSNVASVCISGTATLSAAPSTGYGAATFQWQSSVDGVAPYNDISAATNLSYTTPSITQTSYYKLVVKDQAGAICAQPLQTVVVNSPTISGTTPNSRCGTGTVNLSASATVGNNIVWYSAPTGGVPLAVGNNFTTPVINATTTYYAAAYTGAVGGSYSVGSGATTSATYPNPFYSLWSNTHNQYLIRAAELTAAGITAGPIKGLGVDITSAGTLPVIDLSVKIAATTATDASSFISASFTTVYTSASLMPVTGLNMMTFSAPFNWDGTSNIVIEVCHGNPSSSATMSRTASVDNTSYISTIHTHKSAASDASSTCIDNTTNLTTYSIRPKFIFDVDGCVSARTAVVATVTPPPALTVTADKSICNNAIHSMQVTSTIGDFNTYVWSPVTNLFTDAAATIPYVAGTSASQVYLKTTTAGVTSYTITATNTTTNCVNIATSNVTVLPSTTITSTPNDICVSGTATLAANPATGYGNGTLQWQSSTDGVAPYTDISAATSNTYTTPTLTQTAYYRLLVKDGAGTTCAEINRSVVVNNPQLTGTTPATRCGAGSVTLNATATGGTVNWYAAATGGLPLASGNSFVTPAITATTTYYASAAIAAAANYMGRLAPQAGTGTNLSNYAQEFTITRAIVLNSVDVVSAGGTSITVSLYDATGTTQLQTTGAINVTANTTATINLGWSLAPGTYRLAANAMTGNFIRETTGITYPITLGSLGQINGFVTSLTGTVSTTASYYWFYNWLVTANCETARTPVIATVTPGASATVTAAKTICNNAIHSLQVTSTLSDFDSYVWSPSTGLFTDAAATIAYTGTSASQVYVKTATAGAITYTLTASNSVNSCGAIASSVVTVMPQPVINAEPNEICVSGTTVLSASPATGYGTGTYQWQSSPDGVAPYSNISGANSLTYTTPTISQNAYYSLVLKDGAGSSCNPVLRTVVVNNPQVLTVNGDTRCGPGIVNLSATGSPGATIKWYAAASGGTPVATGNTYSPNVSTNTTYYAAAAAGSGGTQTVGPNSPAIGTNSTWTSTAQWLNFSVLSTATIQSVDIFWSGTVGSNFTLIVRDAGTLSTVFTYNGTTTVSGLSTPQVVPINATLPPGNYQMNFSGTNPGCYRNSTGGVYPYTIPGVISITGNTFDPVYYYMFYRWVVVTGCETTTRTAVTATINPTASNAAGATGATECATKTIAGTTEYNFTDCDLISIITPAGAAPITGSVNSCVKIDNTVQQAPGGEPYVQRHYDITPVTNPATATSDITLLFLQSEFDAFNLARGTYPALPTGPADATGIANLRITQYNGTGTAPGNYTGSVTQINPNDASIVWNSTLSRWQVTFSVTGSGGFYVHTGTWILPVTITSFKGEIAGTANRLYWTTSTESNNSGFEIERSSDGFNYTKIDFVKTKANGGNSSTNLSYSYNDLKPISGINYYRLKQIDNNGKFSYSNVVLLTRKITEISLIRLYPNPATEELNLVIASPKAEKVTISVTDLTGKVVMQLPASLVSGESIQQLNIAKLAGGTYMLKVVCANGCETAVQRFVKQ